MIDNVPWMPRKARIATPPVPNLNPIPRRRILPSTLDSALHNALQDAQIKVNTNLMAELEALKAEKAQLLSNQEKMTKENQFLSAQYGRTTEQLTYLKKKVIKPGNKNKENNDPAKNGGSKRDDPDDTNEGNGGDGNVQNHDNQNQNN